MEKTNRITINVYDGIDDKTAVECVKNVIEMGKISTERHNPVYCFLTFFTGKIGVSLGRYTKNTVFNVYRHKGDDV